MSKCKATLDSDKIVEISVITKDDESSLPNNTGSVGETIPSVQQNVPVSKEVD